MNSTERERRHGEWAMRSRLWWRDLYASANTLLQQEHRRLKSAEARAQAEQQRREAAEARVRELEKHLNLYVELDPLREPREERR